MITVNAAGVVTVQGKGETTIRVVDRKNPLNSDTIPVLAAFRFLHVSFRLSFFFFSLSLSRSCGVVRGGV